MRSFGVVLSALVITLGCASLANASTVTVPNGSTTQSRDWLGVFRAGPGETNVLLIHERGFGLTEFTDAGAPITGQPLVDGAGCSPFGDELLGLLCQPVRNIEAYLGDMDDEARFGFGSGSGQIWTGTGNDVVVVSSGSSDDRVYGEDGNDDLTVSSHGGRHLVDGGPGDDRLNIGGFGPATALGGPGEDRMIFQLAASFTDSSAGRLEGGNGDDHISLQMPGFATVHGDNGADVIDVVAPEDFPLPLGRWWGSYTIYGDSGPDMLSGGPRDDVLDGGSGPDSIEATAGGTDTVICGGAYDVVRADPTDLVAADCERVTLEPEPLE